MHLPKNKFLLSAMASAMLLTACGGGSSGGSTTAASVSGTVVDGYIAGAHVCLDINANQACNPELGEPTTTTDKDGKYSLSTDGISAKQLKTLQILAIVPDTAKDSDDAGQTLAAAGKKGFSLMAPAVDATGKTRTTDVLITPLTTQVSGEVLRGATVSEAEALVRSNLSLPTGTNLYQDIATLAAADAVRLQAQVLAIASGLLANGASGCATQLSILDYLQANIEKLVASVKADTSESTQAAKVQTALNTLDGMTDEKQIADAQCNAKPVDTSKGFALDIYGLDSLGSSVDANYSLDHNANGRYTGTQKHINKGAWEDDTEEASWLDDSGQWVQRSNSGSYSVADDGVVTVKEDVGLESKSQFSQEDISGRKMTDFGDLIDDKQTLGDKTFPTGSTLILTRDRNLTEAFYARNDTPNCGSANCDSLTSFLTAYATDTTAAHTFGYENVSYSFDAANSSATGGNISFRDDSGHKIGSSTYEIRKVHGVDVLVANVCFNRKDCWDLPAFVMKDGVVHYGDYESASLSYESHFNKTAANALLEAFGLPVVVN